MQNSALHYAPQRPVARTGQWLARSQRPPLAVAGSIAALVVSDGATAGTIGDSQAPMVEWIVPALPSVTPRTKEQADEGVKVGHAQVEPEVLQPMLDAALPSYRPRTDIKLSGTFKGAASDVLPMRVKRRIAGFRQYYPDVDIQITPPYGGSLGAKDLVKQKLDFVFVSRTETGRCDGLQGAVRLRAVERVNVRWVVSAFRGPGCNRVFRQRAIRCRR